MNGQIKLPPHLDAISRDTAVNGFTMASEPLTGALLRTLAASKPSGRFLEIGTGTGVGTCWLLDGMDTNSQLVTLERDTAVSALARRNLSHDQRVEFILTNAEFFLKESHPAQFDLIFADTFPGKFYLLEETLASLKIGGLYIVDDLLPQPNWPDQHQAKVDRLISELESRPDLSTVKLAWASGLMIVTKIAQAALPQ